MRTEDDSWDVTTSVGSTGLLVAAARALETQKADPLAIDPYAEVFCRAAGGEWADVLDGKLPDHYLTTGDFGEHSSTSKVPAPGISTSISPGQRPPA